MIKAIIFDLDGTLIDSEPCWREADYVFAKEYGFLLTDDFIHTLSGLGVRESARRFIDTYALKLTEDMIMSIRMKYLYKILFPKLALVPYAKELIERLHAKKYVLALATAGHEQKIAAEILQKLSIDQYFTYVISGLEVTHSKPAPDVYLYAAQRMDIRPQECTVIEDTVNGVLSGKAAGMMVIGVNRNDGIRNNLIEAKADHVFSDLHIPDDFWHTCDTKDR